jgi:hypothetical protein
MASVTRKHSFKIEGFRINKKQASCPWTIEGAKDDIKSNSTAHEVTSAENLTDSRVPIKVPVQLSRQSNFDTAQLRPNPDIAEKI